MEVGRLTGAFDLVTVDQLDLVAQARERCERLVVRVLSDARVERLEGLAPVLPQAERVRLVGALRAVDAVDVADDDLRTVSRCAGSRPSSPTTPRRRRREVLRPRPPSRLPDVADLLVPAAPQGAGVRTGYVPGGWDMFHVGHLRILERARASCDRLVVGVVTDEALVVAKGRPPMVPFAQRAAVVAAFALVDEVVADTSSDKRLAWERVGFDVLFKGDDWQGTAKGDRLEAEMARVGVELRYFPYTPHTSSTALRSVLDAR